jgi:hypothetical protein
LRFSRAASKLDVFETDVFGMLGLWRNSSDEAVFAAVSGSA